VNQFDLQMISSHMDTTMNDSYAPVSTMDVRDQPLIESIIAGVLEPTPWRSFARELRRRFAASYANVCFGRADAACHIAICDTDGIANDLYLRNFDQYRDEDPIRYEALPPGRAVTMDELFTRADLELQSRHLKWARVDHLMILRMHARCGARAWLTVARPESAGSFTPACRQLIEQIGFHFSAALDVFVALKNAEFGQSVHARTTRSLGVGVLVLDQAGVAIQVSDEARRKLAAQRELRIVHGRLRARDRTADLELREGIAVLLRRPAGRERSFSMSIGDEAPLDLLLCAIESSVSLACAPEPRIAIYLSSACDEMVADTHRLAELFQLTNREAALASLLARGRTMSEIADQLNITEKTARTYLKRIFTKTGVRRQADLVRRILTGVACLTATARGFGAQSPRAAHS
jgi:DNA-binding CsgD family transcriptional regulator